MLVALALLPMAACDRPMRAASVSVDNFGAMAETQLEVKVVADAMLPSGFE